MSASAPAAVPVRRPSNAYQMFILVLTVLSLAIMVGLMLPRVNAPTKQLLNVYDNIICIIFLFDFSMRLRRVPRKRDYFIGERGWLDLLGSIPSFGLIADGGKYASLFRLARLSRLARITRLLRGQSKKEIVADVVANRGQYAVYITLLAAMLVLVLGSIFVLQFEGDDPSANITTGGEAIWWAWVTITTVGYGDYFPVTMGGRLTGFFVMLTGIGIIGALASIFASLLVSPSGDAPAAPAPSDGVERELQAVRSELADLRRTLGERGDGPS